MKATCKACIWLWVTITAGLLQLIGMTCTYYLVTDSYLDFNKIFLDGSLLFFSTALAISIAIDYKILFLSNNTNHPFLTWIIYFPIVILVSSLFFSIFCFLSGMKEVSVNIDVLKLRNIELTIFCMTILYSIVAKIIFYDTEENIFKEKVCEMRESFSFEKNKEVN